MVVVVLTFNSGPGEAEAEAGGSTEPVLGQSELQREPL